MSEPIDERRLDAWRTFLKTHAAVVECIARDLSAAGVVPLEWYDVLSALSGAPGRRLRMRELAEAMLLNRSNATRLADRLEAAGLLRREPTPGDRRGTFAVITDAGLAELRRAWPVYAQAIDARFARFVSRKEAAQLGELLGRVYAATPAAAPVPGSQARAARGVSV
ncbi:MAG TPA: MarR family transcriptional regulator [Dehalococcoidia bacterium]|nr:MarR family transcriptional regulator [Dehalococcoidia bacterium]